MADGPDRTPESSAPEPAAHDQATPKAPRSKQMSARPPVWAMLPKYIRGTRIRTSTALLTVLYVLLLWWFLDLRDEFVPAEVRTGTPAPAVTTTAPQPYYRPTYTAPLTTSNSYESTIPDTSESTESPESGTTTTPRRAGESPSASSDSGATVPGRTSGPTTTAAPDGAGVPSTHATSGDTAAGVVPTVAIPPY
jgi:hypothetical protein